MAFFVKRRKIYKNKALLTQNFLTLMKKMLLIVAVAFVAMSCGNKCCEKKCCQDTAAAEQVEVVENDTVK